MNRQVLKQITPIVLLVAMGSVTDSTFAGNVVANYTGAGNPLDQGWTLVGTAGQPLLDDQGFGAYAIDTSDEQTTTRYERKIDGGNSRLEAQCEDSGGSSCGWYG